MSSSEYKVLTGRAPVPGGLVAECSSSSTNSTGGSSRCELPLRIPRPRREGHGWDGRERGRRRRSGGGVGLEEEEAKPRRPPDDLDGAVGVEEEELGEVAHEAFLRRERRSDRPAGPPREPPDTERIRPELPLAGELRTAAPRRQPPPRGRRL